MTRAWPGSCLARVMSRSAAQLSCRCDGLRGPARSCGEPGEDILGVPVGREHWIEDLADLAALGDEGEPLVQRLPLDFERGQPERGAEPELRIRDHRERHSIPLRELELVVEGLRAQPGHARAELCEVGSVVAKCARL